MMQGPDVNMAAEKAFMACNAEEQALYLLALNNSVPELQAQLLISGAKLRLKQELSQSLPAPSPSPVGDGT